MFFCLISSLWGRCSYLVNLKTLVIPAYAGMIFEMTARHDAPLKRALDEAQVVVHGLLARLAQLEVKVIVRHAGEHAHFVEFHVAGDAQVVLVGAYPARHAGEAVAAGAAGLDGLAVLGGIHEEFRGLNESALAAQLMEQVENTGYLLNGVRRAGLLTVAEGRIRNKAGVCRSRGNDSIVEAYAAYLSVGVKFAVELGVGSFFKGKTALRTLREKFHCTSMTPEKLRLSPSFLGRTHILAVR